jgi:hypothetical protein
MGIAFGLACAIVLAEVSMESARRMKRLDRRVGTLKSSVQKLEQKSALIEQRLLAEHPHGAVEELLSRVLVAPDLRAIRLAAVDSRRPASGTILVSARTSAAVLSATGLAPSGQGKVYRLWWINRRGSAVKAAEFQVASATRVRIAADPPPNDDEMIEARVTLEPLADAHRPAGELALSGKFGR